jgi:hypothetical protein
MLARRSVSQSAPRRSAGTSSCGNTDWPSVPNERRSAANALIECGRAAAATKDICVRQQQRGLGRAPNELREQGGPASQKARDGTRDDGRSCP